MGSLLIIGAVVWCAMYCNAGVITGQSHTRFDKMNHHAQQDIINTTNVLSIHLFQHSFKEHPDLKNFVFSLGNTIGALSVLTSGAHVYLENQFRKAFGFPVSNGYRVNDLFEAFVYNLDNLHSSSTNYLLAFFNIIYYRAGYKMSPEFQSIMKFSHATAQSLDFKDRSKSVKMVEDLYYRDVKDNFDQRMLDDVNKPDICVVTWGEFKGNARSLTKTQNMPFWVNNNGISRRITVPSMSGIDHFNCGKLTDLSAKFIQIPFENNGPNRNMSMIIILPDNPNEIDNLRNNIDPMTIYQLFNRKKLTKVYVELPEFKISMESLFEANTTMNFPNLFTNAADTNILRYKSYVKVAVKAGAPRQLLNVEKRMSSYNGPMFIANYNFIFIIGATGEIPVIYFMGQQYGPNKLI